MWSEVVAGVCNLAANVFYFVYGRSVAFLRRDVLPDILFILLPVHHGVHLFVITPHAWSPVSTATRMKQ